jgi:hypothetical protein
VLFFSSLPIEFSSLPIELSSLPIEFPPYKQVVHLIGESHVSDLLKMFKANVQVHKTFYAYWIRKNIRHYDEYNNCSLEGTNFGMKNHAAPARPMHSIQKSVNVQIQQATIACATNETTIQLMIDKCECFGQNFQQTIT